MTTSKISVYVISV